MARVDNKGFIHGKLGDKIYYVRDKEQIVRNLPKKSSVPPSEAQLLQRKKFKIASKLSNELKPIFQYFRCDYVKKGIGKFTAHILQDVVTVNNNKFALDFSSLVLIRGMLDSHFITSFSSVFPQTISLKWDSKKSNSYPNYHIGLVVYCPNLNKHQIFFSTEYKNKGEAIFRINEEFIGLDLYCWTFSFLNNKYPLSNDQHSCNHYLGKIKV